jgi:lysophospholipase L1-like esterase
MIRGWNAIVALAVFVAACGGGGGGGGGGEPAKRGIGLEDIDGDGEIFVIAFGDSITRGVGDGPDADAPPPPLQTAGYPARLQALLGVPVFNFGIPGEETREGVRRLPEVLQRTRADYVIILEGVNDIEFGRDGDAVENLQSMVGTVFESGSMPILGTLTPTCCTHSTTAPEDRILRFNDAIRAIATAGNVPVIDFHAAFVPDPMIGFDPSSGLIQVPEGLHPTPLGYDVMARAAADAFEPGLGNPETD